MMKFGDWLVDKGVISSQQLEAALAKQKILKEHQMLGQILVQMGVLSAEEMIKYSRDHIEAKHGS